MSAYELYIVAVSAAFTAAVLRLAWYAMEGWGWVE